MALETARSRAAMFDRARAALGGADALVWVPGRIEVLGKHVDYGGGRSLMCAVEKGFCFAVRRRSDAVVRVGAPEKWVESVLDQRAPALGGWGNYVSTVARRLARNFPGLRGVDVAFVSDLPQAAGLSSSSALVVGMFMALDAVNGIVEREELLQSREGLAGYLGLVENGQSYWHLGGDRGVGTFGGSQDHTAILCSEHDHLSEFMYCPVKSEMHWPMPADLIFVVACSGVHAAKADNALEQYNSASLRLAKVLEI